MIYSNFCFTLLHEENVFKTVNTSVLEKDHLEVQFNPFLLVEFAGNTNNKLVNKSLSEQWNKYLLWNHWIDKFHPWWMAMKYDSLLRISAIIIQQ